jgi:serine/threonine-protein kinase
MLTGDRPFDGSMSAIMHKALSTEPPRPSALSVTAPPALDAVVARAMAKRPEGRFDSAASFAAAMKAALEAPPPAPEPLAEDDATVIAPRRAPAPVPVPATAGAGPVRKARGGLIAGLGVAVLAVAGAGAYFALNGPKPPPAPQAAPPGEAARPPLAASPPPAPATTPEQIRTALAAALSRAGCSLTHTREQAAGVAVYGVVNQQSEAALRSLASAALPPGAAPDAYDLRVETFPGTTYCDALNLLRGAAPAPLALSLQNGSTLLKQGDLLKPQIALPDYPAWITVDYLQSDGSITHLYPRSTDKPRREPAGSLMVLGDPAKTAFPVDTPFGTDMIIAIASSAPVVAPHRPDEEKSAPYLAALARTLQSAQRANARISASAILVTTEPAPPR